MESKVEIDINKCSNLKCSNAAKLRCPHCKKYGIKDGSFFCGKECFNSCWTIHKVLHEDCKNKIDLKL